MKKKSLGYHILVDFFGCNPQKINDKEFVRETMLEVARIAKATIVNDLFHSFNPQGLSGVVVIAESHIAFHSWPEYGCVAVDIFSCNSNMETDQAIKFMKTVFEAESETISKTERGVIK